MKQGEFIAWLEGYVAAAAWKRPSASQWRQVVRNLKLMQLMQRQRLAIPAVPAAFVPLPNGGRVPVSTGITPEWRQNLGN